MNARRSILTDTRMGLACLALACTATARACLWDSDTIAMEKARFPEAADLIAGKFPRHSREFYEWRKKRCEAALAKDPQQAAVYDDLAVAQHKLGDHRAAIATMEAKEKMLPGIYETYSNMGTFYIYTGELDEAAKWIGRALKVNPDAHFGREKYQLWLVEWLKAGKPQNKVDGGSDTAVDFSGFAAFVVQRSGYKGKSRDWTKGREEALRGIMGMMRFADYDNPLLLEALGDLLLAGEFEDNAALLAAQSYLLASRRSKTDAEKQRLWKRMEEAGGTVDEYKPRDTMRGLDAALAESASFVAKVRSDELAWITAEKNVAAEFDAKYLKRETRTGSR